MSWDEDIDRWMRRWRNIPAFRGFEEMDRMFDNMFREMLKDVPTDLYKERRLPGGGIVRQAGPFVYGYSMTVGPDGKPVIREFGNVKSSKRPTPFGFGRPSLEVKEEREPLVDVIPENGTLRIIAEVPGIEKKDIKLHCTERSLTISVDTENRKYYKTIDLPDVIDPKISKASYRNGVLEIILTKLKKEQPKGETIDIE